MKPERLEMEGFAAYRAKTAVDFSGLDLFALTGPTGSGKSSVIDAITFALYGVVTRYDLKSVAPIISLGASEARVRLDFTVGGDHYTVARVVRRTSGRGATTAEARLERDGSVVESGAKPVSAAIESLLGLSVEHFTRSVVLPQGQFAAFLHDKPANQQGLVKALLDMGMLEGVRRLAGERAKTASALVDQTRSRLDGLEGATPEAMTSASARVAELSGLTDRVEALEEGITRAVDEARRKAETATELATRGHRAEAVEAPSDVGELARSLAESAGQAAATEQVVKYVEEALEELEQRTRSLPSSDRIEAMVGAITRIGDLELRLARIDLDAIESAYREAVAEREIAEASRATAQKELARLNSRHAAHALAAGLEAGDPCPVCTRPLEAELPPAPPDLSSAEQAVRSCETALRAASDSERAAERSLDAARMEQQNHVAELATLSTAWPELPGPDQLSEMQAERAAADEALAEERRRMAEARATAEDARRQVASLSELEKRAWERFEEARDAVSDLKPPPSARGDLAEEWDRLVTWAASEAKKLRDDAEDAVRQADLAARSVEEARSAAAVLLQQHEIGGSGSPTARLAGALASAEADERHLAGRLEERRALEGDLATWSESADVARSLVGHLQAPNFEGWVLAEALALLVEGANELLGELSGHAYSLVLAKVIEVVDHRNADERRPVRSLSGGETFLVSLALALSLGEQLAAVSERGAVALEAIFLDEGFGTLDAETLDMVGTVVAELAARGRMVGLVTHVKELADQAPARFEVRPGPTGSTIARVGT